jgi:hypothetical protein
VVKPGQTVVTESSGYLGYDTNGTWYDFPGLESPTVLDTIRKGKAENAPVVDSLYGIADALRPDWLILRPAEAAYTNTLFPDLLKSYRQVREFSVPNANQFEVSAGGFSVLDLDRTFIVYRRID